MSPTLQQRLLLVAATLRAGVRPQDATGPRAAPVRVAYAAAIVTPRDEPDEWAEWAEAWDDDPTARAYAAAAHGSLLEVLDAHGLDLVGVDVIDFGCGTGLLTERLVGSAASILAVDRSPAMLSVLRRKIDQRGWTTVAPALVVPTDPPTVDLVVCSSVCSFLDDYPGTTAGLADLLRPGGVFVQWDWERTGDDPHGLTRSEIDAALRAAGLDGVVVDVGFTCEADGETMQPLVGHGGRP